MKHTNRITAVMLVFVLFLSMLGAAFFLAEHTQHNCAGENCAVCAVLEQCDQRLRGAVYAAAAAVLLLLFARHTTVSADARLREASGVTPVALKVKLLN